MSNQPFWFEDEWKLTHFFVRAKMEEGHALSVFFSASPRLCGGLNCRFYVTSQRHDP
jgi:hypothetical protein